MFPELTLLRNKYLLIYKGLISYEKRISERCLRIPLEELRAPVLTGRCAWPKGSCTIH